MLGEGELALREGLQDVAVARRDGEPYASRADTWNDTIRAAARDRHIPLLDYWAANRSLPNQGVSSDGVHPNTYQFEACVFTPAALSPNGWQDCSWLLPGGTLRVYRRAA